MKPAPGAQKVGDHQSRRQFWESRHKDEIKSEDFKSLAKTYYYDFMVFNDIYDIVDKLGYIIIKK